MKANITNLPVGTRFLYDGMDYEVTGRGDYPFILAKCHTQPNDYNGLDIMFANFEQVEVPDDTVLLEIKPVVYTASKTHK